MTMSERSQRAMDAALAAGDPSTPRPVRPVPPVPPRRAAKSSEPVLLIILGLLFTIPAAVLLYIPDVQFFGWVLLVVSGVIAQIGIIAQGVLVGLRRFHFAP